MKQVFQKNIGCISWSFNTDMLMHQKLILIKWNFSYKLEFSVRLYLFRNIFKLKRMINYFRAKTKLKNQRKVKFYNSH